MAALRNLWYSSELNTRESWVPFNIKAAFWTPSLITDGLKRGCILALTLFSIYLVAILQEMPDDNPGIDLRYCTDGGLFNIARLQSRTQTTNAGVTEFQYADDNCTLAHKLEDFQRIHALRTRHQWGKDEGSAPTMTETATTS